MATKLQLITELSQRTAHSVTRNPADWTSFLKTAAWNYKYPFQDQLLIYAQRPDATACAPIEIWNRKFGRWVNRGAKGIALIDDSGSRLNLRHVFDISDTNSRYNRPPVLWSMQDRYAEAVTETLENSFGDLKDKSDISSALVSAAFNAVEDNYADYLSDLMYCRENSFLEELDGLNVEVIFKAALRSSVAYMLLVRCGYPADNFFSFEDFQGVVNFNTIDTVSRLGAAASDISEMLLREIEATVKDLQKTERKQIRTVAKNQGAGHNESRKDERDGEHGTDLHNAGRLPDTRPDAAGGRNAHRQVWDVAQNISEKPPERDVRQPDAVGQADGAPRGDRPDGEGTYRKNHGEAPHEQPPAGQSSRPDGLDGTHEQPAALGGRNGTGGAGVQLTLFPTVEQQIESIKQAEDENSSAFSISQEEIDHVLCKGTGFQDGKFRVYLHYREQHTPKETIDFLKREYGTGGGTHIFTDGTRGNTWHDGKGITITKDSTAEPDAKIILPWAKVQKRIGELIAADRYLNSKEKERLPVVQQEMEERRRQLAEEAYAREILNREPAPAEPKVPISKDTAKYVFHLGDTVYLGAEEYEVLSFDGITVQLRDTRYPLFIKELPREAFERMLRDNPLNDHLIAPEQPAEEKTEIPSPRALYRTYLSEIVGRVRTDEIYPYLRDRDTDPDSAKQELDAAIDRIVLYMREEHPDFYEAYTNLPQFREWLHEDVFQRVYQDHLADSRDSIAIHADDPGAPEWARETGDITITREGDTATIGSSGEGEKHDVELDLELPESQTEQEEKEPAEKEIAAGMELSIEDRRYVIDSINIEAETVSLRDITFQQSTGFPIFRSESIAFVRGVLEQSEEPIWQKAQCGKVSKVVIDLRPETPKPHQPRSITAYRRQPGVGNKNQMLERRRHPAESA